ncbi:MAG: aromatic aminobenezylarsenical efflux permease ArsG family transporter [Pirellulales bacterium]|jgi:cytochrome c-type biogenesis protein
MDGLLLGTISALWLGILTSISPCPMATNIAAISFIGRRVGNARQVLLAGLLYTLGRTAVYVVLGMLLAAAVVSSAEVSIPLQKLMNRLLGPILIVVAMFLLDLIQLNFSGSGMSDKMQTRVEAWGVWGAGLLGVVFALSFCPVSAALFFGSLLALSVECESSLVVPSVYGIGTALPVFVFAVLIALGAQSVGKAFNRLSQIEWWARRITGGVFLAVGIYLSLKYIFGWI